MMADCKFDKDNILPLTINSGAVFVSVLALVGIITHRKIEESLRGILMSFLVANVMAASMFIYDIVTFACITDKDALHFTYKVSSIISLAHILLLIVHYHIAISSNRTTKVKDFVALILTAWITSATIGCLNAALKESVNRILTIVVFILIILFIIKSFHFVANESIHQRENSRIYKRKFLLEALVEDEKEMEEDEYGSPPIKQWNLKFVGSMALVSVLTPIPWLIFDFVDFSPRQKRLQHALPLSIYVLSFYLVASLCIYMRYRDFRYGRPAFDVGRNHISPVFEAKRHTLVKKTSKDDLVSNMESEECYGTF